MDPIGSPSNGKVIIRLASTLSTPAPAGRRQSSNDGHDGCSCESVDDCPVELMDFRFAVACDHGTVRCCRPVESNNAQDINDAKNAENVKNTVKIVTPVTLVKRPKKTAMCKCKPRKECDHFFHSEDAQDRKDNLCPSGMVRCCETGNMGNSKDDLIKGQTVPSVQQNLDNNQFKPVQLPFLKMPHPDTNIPPQELAIPADNTTHHKPKQVMIRLSNGTVIAIINDYKEFHLIQPEMIGESVPVAPVTNKQPESLIPTTQQPFSVPPNHRQPQQQQFGPPQQVRPPVQAYQPLASNPGMNLPVRQPHRPMPNRPYMYPPPITQFGFNPPHQQPQQHFQPGGVSTFRLWLKFGQTYIHNKFLKKNTMNLMDY